MGYKRALANHTPPVSVAGCEPLPNFNKPNNRNAPFAIVIALRWFDAGWAGASNGTKPEIGPMHVIGPQRSITDLGRKNQKRDIALFSEKTDF